MEKEPDMAKRPMLTEAEIVSNPELVERIKNARPVGSPMSGAEAIKWIKSIR
jgi:hypothetical protein